MDRVQIEAFVNIIAVKAAHIFSERQRFQGSAAVKRHRSDFAHTGRNGQFRFCSGTEKQIICTASGFCIGIGTVQATVLDKEPLVPLFNRNLTQIDTAFKRIIIHQDQC